MTPLPTSLPAQLCATGAVVWCLAYLGACWWERRKKRKEDEAWIDALLEKYHADLAKRFRNGQWKPKDKYGKFTVPERRNTFPKHGAYNE